MPMPDSADDVRRHAYEYALIRVVPRVDREEFVNVGVILFCRTLRFLDLRLRLDEARLTGPAPRRGSGSSAGAPGPDPPSHGRGRPLRRAGPGRTLPLGGRAPQHHGSGVPHPQRAVPRIP